MALKLSIWTDRNPRARRFQREFAAELAELLCVDGTKRPPASLTPEVRMHRALLRYSLGVRAVAIREVLHRLRRAH